MGEPDESIVNNSGYLYRLLLSSQFWPMLSMSRGVINCAILFHSHRFSRIKTFDQWAVDRDPFLTSTTSAKIGKTAIFYSRTKSASLDSYMYVSGWLLCCH